MKLLPLLLSLSLLAVVAPVSLTRADCGTSCSKCAPAPVTFMVTKVGEHKAKFTNGAKEVVVPIVFADGATWDSVKDSYALPCEYACLLEAGKFSVSIAPDGKATFHGIKK